MPCEESENAHEESSDSDVEDLSHRWSLMVFQVEVVAAVSRAGSRLPAGASPCLSFSSYIALLFSIVTDLPTKNSCREHGSSISSIKAYIKVCEVRTISKLCEFRVNAVRKKNGDPSAINITAHLMCLQSLLAI